MDYDLSKRHYAALEALRFECDYEDGHNDGELIYVLRNQLPVGIGDKTLSDLEGWELIEAGTNKWFNSPGYRITDLGRRVLEAKPPKKPKAKPKHSIRRLGSRLGAPKGRLDRK
jgi:hypothetical protein